MPAVHFVGEIVSARGFSDPALFCTWRLASDDSNWRLVDGTSSGRTWVSEATDSCKEAVWNHPIDVSYSCTGVQGWPKLFVEVTSQDKYGREDIAGYGFAHVPPTPGSHKVRIATYRPRGTSLEYLASQFLGGMPSYDDPSVVMTAEPRLGHYTVTTGYVFARIDTIVQNFQSSVELRQSEALNSLCQECPGPDRPDVWDPEARAAAALEKKRQSVRRRASSVAYSGSGPPPSIGSGSQSRLIGDRSMSLSRSSAAPSTAPAFDSRGLRGTDTRPYRDAVDPRDSTGRSDVSDLERKASEPVSRRGPPSQRNLQFGDDSSSRQEEQRRPQSQTSPLSPSNELSHTARSVSFGGRRGPTPAGHSGADPGRSTMSAGTGRGVLKLSRGAGQAAQPASGTPRATEPPSAPVLDPVSSRRAETPLGSQPLSDAGRGGLAPLAPLSRRAETPLGSQPLSSQSDTGRGGLAPLAPVSRRAETPLGSQPLSSQSDTGRGGLAPLAPLGSTNRSSGQLRPLQPLRQRPPLD